MTLKFQKKYKQLLSCICSDTEHGIEKAKELSESVAYITDVTSATTAAANVLMILDMTKNNREPIKQKRQTAFAEGEMANAVTNAMHAMNNINNMCDNYGIELIFEQTTSRKEVVKQAFDFSIEFTGQVIRIITGEQFDNIEPFHTVQCHPEN